MRHVPAIAKVLLVAGFVGVLTAAWWLGGYSICSGYMARYDMLAGICVGGKLLDKTYRLGWEEQSLASFQMATTWVFVVGYLAVGYFLWPLLRSIHRPSSNEQHEA